MCISYKISFIFIITLEKEGNIKCVRQAQEVRLALHCTLPYTLSHIHLHSPHSTTMQLNHKEYCYNHMIMLIVCDLGIPITSCPGPHVARMLDTPFCHRRC